MSTARRLASVPLALPGAQLLLHLVEHGAGTFLDLREHHGAPTKRDPERVSPTSRYVILPASRIPLLRAALQRAEEQALAAGLLTAEDYRTRGLTPPASLLEVA